MAPTGTNGEDPAVTNFREYLRIPSVHPNTDYDECVNFLKNQAKSLSLPVRVFCIVPKKPIVVLTWQGSEPQLPAVLLNSHMDVVPVFPDEWTHPPFAAEKDGNGNIYARGSQDMKCVGIQYLEAIRRLKNQGITLRRTVHISFVPDEEIGGIDGMKKFVHTPEFRELGVGFSLDEGMASEDEYFRLFSGERTIWQLKIHCRGTPGHGSLLLPDTAAEKLRIIVNRFMDFREKEKNRLEANPDYTVGDVTTVNMTTVEGGIQPNVVPSEMTAVFDVRLATDVNHDEFEKMISSWCTEAGLDVEVEYLRKEPKVEVTKLDNSNPWWVSFKKVCDEMGLKLRKEVFPGGTDSRFIRYVGIPALGFSPMNKTPVLLHAHDEFLNETIFLRGIEIYCKLVSALANVL